MVFGNEKAMIEANVAENFVWECVKEAIVPPFDVLEWYQQICLIVEIVFLVPWHLVAFLVIVALPPHKVYSHKVYSPMSEVKTHFFFVLRRSQSTDLSSAPLLRCSSLRPQRDKW